MRKREISIEIFDSVADADEANLVANRKLSGIERVRMVTAIVGGNDERPKSRLPRTYRIVDVPRR